MSIYKEPAWGLLAVLALIVVGTGIYYYSRPQTVPAARMELMAPGVNLALAKVRFFEFQQNRLSWELTGQAAEYRAGTQELLLARPWARIFLENGDQVAVSGEEGRYWGPEGRLELRGAVQGENSQGYHLETDRLIYLASSRELSSAGPVKIWSQGLTVLGDRLRGNLASRKFEIEGKVQVHATDLKWGGG